MKSLWWVKSRQTSAECTNEGAMFDFLKTEIYFQSESCLRFEVEKCCQTQKGLIWALCRSTLKAYGQKYSRVRNSPLNKLQNS